MLHMLLPGAALYADRKTKQWAREGTEVDTRLDAVQWQPLENAGLAAGKLSGQPKAARAIHGGAFAAMCAALFPEWRFKCGMEKLGAWFLIFGAAANLYDRLCRGTVTDMFRFPKAPGKLRTYVFNIADFMIFAGAILTVLGRLLRKR